MKIITDILNRKWNITDKCLGCEIINENIKVPFGIIYETKTFSVMQDMETPIPGFMIISCKKHIKSILDLTKQEYEELMELCYKIRKAMNNIEDIIDVAIIQKELAPHFHLWLFPRYEWMINNKELEIGYGSLADYTKILLYARQNHKDKKHINKIEEYINKIKTSLND